MIALEIVEEIISKVREKYGVELKVFDIVEPPPEHGDFSLPCFRIGKEVKRDPREISKELSSEKFEGPIKEIRAEGPYLNFYLDHGKALEEIILGKPLMSFKGIGKRAIVEHTSANPTGPLHVGRARNSIIGDSVARILSEYGYDVIREYYVDDMGYQASLLVWGCMKFGKEEGTLEEYAEVYMKANQLGEKEEVAKLLREYERGEHKEIFSKVIDSVMRGILEELREIGVEFDSLVKESELVFSGRVQRVLRSLESLGIVKSEGGAKYVDLKDILPELAEDMEDTKVFLTRSDGTSLYVLRDIAYHVYKSERAEKLVNVLGEDHKLEGNLIRKMMEILEKTPPDLLFYSFVSLPEGRMSTRRGRAVFLKDLISEGISRALKEVKERRPDLSQEEAVEIARKVGIGAIRFNIVKTQPEKPITFRWEEALSLERDSAPFVMYSYVRCLGILKKVEEDPKPPFEISNEFERKVISKALKLPLLVKISAETLRPHLVAKYCLELAAEFNKFYDNCPVLKEENEKRRNARIGIVKITKEALEKGMNLLGIKMPEKM